jgi:hypothetical protein
MSVIAGGAAGELTGEGTETGVPLASCAHACALIEAHNKRPHANSTSRDRTKNLQRIERDTYAAHGAYTKKSTRLRFHADIIVA